MSQKMLTQTLRSLVRDGFVTRTVIPSVPVQVNYALTPLGEDLQVQVGHLKTWAEKHMDKVFESRKRHDSAHARLKQGA